MQHRFPPRVLLWTNLCSCLHLPISELNIQPLQQVSTCLKSPSRSVPSRGARMSVPNEETQSVHQLCFMEKMTPNLCEDATSATRLVSLMSFPFAALSPGLLWASVQRTGTWDNQDGSLYQNHHCCHGDSIATILTAGWDSVLRATEGDKIGDSLCAAKCGAVSFPGSIHQYEKKKEEKSNESGWAGVTHRWQEVKGPDSAWVRKKTRVK